MQEVKLREGLAVRSLARPGSEPTPKIPGPGRSIQWALASNVVN